MSKNTELQKLISLLTGNFEYFIQLINQRPILLDSKPNGGHFGKEGYGLGNRNAQLMYYFIQKVTALILFG